jgi:sugar/nucleoside kinase (ribokinase family)
MPYAIFLIFAPELNHPMKKILGIGNALVDIMTEMDHDGYLQKFELPKGSMILVDAAKSRDVFHGTQHLKQTIRSGGSAANTIYGIARMGLETGYIGKIGHDEMGNIFRNDLEKSNIRPHLTFSDIESGRAMALISPDAERTFATYLGAAVDLADEDMDESVFRNYDIIHFEGYLVQNHALLNRALELARKNHIKISLDLASYNVVEANRDFLQSIIQNYVDVVFANEDEARALTGKEPEAALEELAASCDIAVVKLGKNGSLVKAGGQRHEVGIIDVKSIDTTGAGDLYASGFLYGLANNMAMEKCGQIGAILAGHVIEVIGAKIPDEKWDQIKDSLGKI